MTKFSPIESEFGDQADAHDAWVRAKVEHALASTKPRYTHGVAMAWIDTRIEDRRRARNNLDD